MKTSFSRSFVCVVTIFVMFVALAVAGVANAQPASGLSPLERIARKQAENAIITAVKKDDLNAVAACVTKDRTLVNTVDDSKDGQTLVHLAVKAENLTLLKCLIAWEANLETPDKNGKTPLKVAVEAKKVEAVLYLLANEAGSEDVPVGELAALPLGDLSDSQYISKYIVEKSEKEVKRLIDKELDARAAAAQKLKDDEKAARIAAAQAAADAAKEAEKERIRREQEAAAEKEIQRKEAVAEFHKIVTPAVFIQLMSDKNGERELAFNTLKDKFIVNRVGQRYEFSIKIWSSTGTEVTTRIDESLGIDATEKADITKNLNALQRIAKYLASGVAPSKYDALRSKVMTCDKQNADIIFGNYEGITGEDRNIAILAVHNWMFSEQKLSQSNLQPHLDFDDCMAIMKIERNSMISKQGRTVENFRVSNLKASRDPYYADHRGYVTGPNQFHNVANKINKSDRLKLIMGLQ